MNKRRKLLWAVVLLIVGGYFGYNYLYKGHRNIESETSKIEIAAPYLQERFVNDDAKEILNTTITVTGIVTQIETKAVTIDAVVYCTFEKSPEGLSVNDKVRIKGRCIGYDDLFEVVKLDQCTLIK
jgi:hypothetical protein